MAFENYDKCSLLLPMDGANNGTVFDDWSKNNTKLIRAGDVLPVTSTTQSKYYGSSGLFPQNTSGSPARLHMTNNNVIGTKSFLIGAWVRVTNKSTSLHVLDERIVDGGFSSITLSDNNFLMLWNGSLQKFRFVFGTGPTALDSTTEAINDTWMYFQVSRDKSNVLRISVNGIIENSLSSVTNNFNNIYGAIGGTSSTENIYARNINDLMIQIDIDPPTSDFTPPTRLIGELSNANALAPVEDETGTPSERTIIAVPRTYPTRAFGTVSDVNGDFTLRAPATECSIIALHEGDPIKNDLIYRVTPV